MHVDASAPSLAEIRTHASAAYPAEGCGVLIGRGTADAAGGTVAIVRATAGRNLRTDRAADRYELDPGDIVRAEREARAAGLDVVGFWHSHPDHPARPSGFDTERAWTDYVYVIVTTMATGTGDLGAFLLEREGGPFTALELRAGATPGVG